MAAVRHIARPGLARRLESLAARAGVSLAGIGEWQVDRREGASALVAGVGRRRHVLIASELMRDWSDDEIAVVVAHELAHHAFGDLWWTLGLNALLLSVALGATDVVVRVIGPLLGLGAPTELAALPLVAFLGAAAWLATVPLRHAQSRRQERRADAFALAATGDADAFRTAVRRLGARHLAEERPSAFTRWLFHRHPPIADRLELADAFDGRGSARSRPGLLRDPV
jgi:STE24 endopeptidase